MFQLLYSRHWNSIVRGAVPLLVAVYGLLVWLCAEAARPYLRNAIRYAVAFGVVQLAVLAFSIVALTAAKHWRIRGAIRRELRCASLAERLASHAAAQAPHPEEAAALIAAAAKAPGDFIQVIDVALRSIRGSGHECLRSLCLSGELFPKLAAESRDPNPQRAIVALRVLGHLPSEEARRIMEENCSDPRAVVRMTARQLVFANGSPECQLQVLSELALAPHWERIVLFQNLPAGSPVISRFLAGSWESTREEIVISALELVLSLQRFFPVYCAEVLAEHPSAEVRIKFFRALPLLVCAADAAPVVRAGLRDPDWRVRAMTARACRSLQLSAFSAELLAICRSPECAAEAGHAASALASLGGQAWSDLRELASRGTAVTRQIAGIIERTMLGATKGAAH